MAEGPHIPVLLADDHAMVREALARVLEESGTIDVVGQVSDGRQVLDAVESTNAECLVLDYSMPHLDAPQVIEALIRRRPDVRILVLTVHENVHYAVRALESGAHGYLIKSAAVDELVAAIQAVHAGEIYISSRISQDVLHHLRRPKRHRTGLEALSPREFDLLRSLGAGNSLQECARQMQVSTSTASTYRARVMQKLNLTSTAELIRFALEHGFEG